MTEDVLKIFSEPTAGWFAETFGKATKVQEEAWPAIAAGKPVLVSAPTGTGKTLSAFLVFIDRLSTLAREGRLEEKLYLIYVSPLKSLAGDIRENLRRPLDGIGREEGQQEITVGIRTGDTPQKERQRMVKHPPHILIITPESLYLMLTSRSGQSVVKTAEAVIIDELHALIDTKRGAHLMLSVARLDRLCGRNLQRIGLSATIEPLELSAEYLSPEPTVICAPAMEKKVFIEVVGTTPANGRRKDPVWEELGMAVYQKCLDCKSVIAFSEGRRYAEKLAYYVNLLGGDGFARVHHGSLSKEQRAEVEQELREGRLRLLCATSSMELGIDVGDIDQVLQIGCPRTVSSTMQRLGRAGHNPGSVSVMYMYPRTAPESVYCGMTAETARLGGVEHTKPPRMCLDVLAQHLVSMAAGDGYRVDEVMDILNRAYSFRDVTREDVKSVLRMLAGDYEHGREIPVRPRVLYDRIHERVNGDAYSRMLAVAAGGTIPDKGLYAAKTEDGVKLGELDEEFVYESQIGDKFVLGSFAWKIVSQDRDTVVVTQVPAEGARLPFWKGETRGRTLRTSLAFGRLFRELGKAAENGPDALTDALNRLGLDDAAACSAASFLRRQIDATGGLPDDRTIVVERFTDHTGSNQVMVHALFGRRVNAPLSLLLQHTARQLCGIDIGSVDEEEGVLLYPYGDDVLPEGLLFQIDEKQARSILEAALPLTPLFNMTFRYNASRALMMGMKRNGRQPLWMQRLKSTEMLSSLIHEPGHPLIRETKRECLEDQWDIDGVLRILGDIRAGLITVREVCVDVPSPMSLPFQWQAEAAEMYEYSPVTQGIREAVYEELKTADMIKPQAEELARLQERKKLPEDEEQLHSLLMMEGDLIAGELPVPVEWLENLAERELVAYMEPGIWIAAEQREEYELALLDGNEEAAMHIVRRMLYYRGGQNAEAVRERYFFPEGLAEHILEKLAGESLVVEDEGIFYHAKIYDRARRASIKGMRLEAVTQPASHYAALMAGRAFLSAPGEEQLRRAVEQLCGRPYPVKFWESVFFARRVKNYTEAMLDRLLAQGDYFWQMKSDGTLAFYRYEDIDWEAPLTGLSEELEGDEKLMYQELMRRGASFLKFLTEVPKQDSAQDVLLKLAEKGLVCADSFVPVRQWQNREKVKKATARQRVNVRVMALSAGRWDIVRPVRKRSLEEWLDLFLKESAVLCKETFRRSCDSCAGSAYMISAGASAGDREEAGELTWRKALDVLRIWEYTGNVRRGYFVSGMSGAQFIRKEEYESVTAALKQPEDEVIWLNASDPAQIWGKVLEQPEGSSFMNIPGTAAALRQGRAAAVMERQGKVLRIFEEEGMEAVLSEFVRCFQRKLLFPDQKRLILKEYPEHAGELLKKAGFIREMQDYVLYR